MRDPRMMHYYHTETAHCDFCDILFFRTLVIAFTVLSTIIGAVIVGFSLVIKGANEYRDDLLDAEFGNQLNKLATAMVVVGAIVMIMSIVGCLAAIFENSWFTVIFILTLIMCMASQVSCGILTLFLRKEIQNWVEDQTDCETCYEQFEKALKYPTVNAIIMLAALGIQLAVIASECKASHMRKSAKRAMLLGEFVPHEDILHQEDKKSTMCPADYRSAKRYECLKEEEVAKGSEVSAIQHEPLAEGQDLRPGAWDPETARPRPSASPTKLSQHQPSPQTPRRNSNTNSPITEGEVLVH